MGRKAQSLIELSVMGAIIIGVLAVLINYGLGYNFDQQVMQRSFRQAMGRAYERGSASVMTLWDRHAPDPSHLFGFGAYHTSSSASTVIRDYRMYETPVEGDDNDLPRIIYDFANIPAPDNIQEFLTADYSRHNLASSCGEFEYEKYKEIYGERNVWYPDENDTTVVTVMDTCDGEIIDYTFCKYQCRRMTDRAYCVQQCRLGSLRPDVCVLICDQTMEIPWYCDKLDALFSFALTDDGKVMGVVGDRIVLENRYDAQLSKQESPWPGGGVAQTDTLSLRDTITRRFIYRQRGDTSGGVADLPLDSPVDMDATITDFTPW